VLIKQPDVSIVVPCRNEGQHIVGLLDSIAKQDFDGTIEVFVADGQSSDDTLAEIDKFHSSSFLLAVIPNPGLTVSKGLNLAISHATGTFVVRMDVHTTYDCSYVSQCVKALQQTGAGCVGGPWVANGQTQRGKQIATAFQSKLGGGLAMSRQVDFSGPVDTVYLGAWRRELLLEAGGFDENLIRNQDDELCLRIKKLGHQIFQSAGIVSSYTPRGSFRQLYRQYRQYGFWKVFVWRKHGGVGSPRHIILVAALTGCLSLLALAPFFRPALWVLLSAAFFYFAILGATCFVPASRDRTNLCWVSAAVVTMHLAYSIGLVEGFTSQIFKKAHTNDSRNSKLSR
jgi:succinoglycan biosynthesis protein ExoA